VRDIIQTPFGSLRIDHPPGTFAPSPATHIMVRVLTAPSRTLAGRGLDWGSGTGTLAIAAAMRPEVVEVVGLDISEEDVAAARGNAQANGVADKTVFLRADSFQALEPAGRHRLARLRGMADFITANPPASIGDDGFSFRHIVIHGALAFLRPGGVLLMQALSAYGPERFARMLQATPGFAYDGVVGSTPAIPLELERSGLIRQLRDYAAEERRNGLPYHFEDPAGVVLSATAALRRYLARRVLPRARWQVHQFVRVGDCWVVAGCRRRPNSLPYDCTSI
jgi:SAM-dependent methyltransferase